MHIFILIFKMSIFFSSVLYIMNYNCCLNKNIGHVNYYLNNGGGSSTMKKKHASKFNKVSSNKLFSLNGNSSHTYIGNPNTVVTNNIFSNNSGCACKTFDNSVKTSTKNTKALINKKLYESPVNSYKCYLNVNKELIDEYNQDISNGVDKSKAGVNKHLYLNANNKDQSTHVQLLKSSLCNISKETYTQNILDSAKSKSCHAITGVSNSKKNINAVRNCNITKDLVALEKSSSNYNIYLISKLNSCNYNPPDAKVIGCITVS